MQLIHQMMNLVFNYLKDIIVNYNYYEIVFQCYLILNVQFDLLGNKRQNKNLNYISNNLGKMLFKKKIIHIMIFVLKKHVFYIILVQCIHD